MTEGIGDGLLEHVPARRAGTPEEVAACVRFLASERRRLRNRRLPDRRRRADRLTSTRTERRRDGSYRYP